MAIAVYKPVVALFRPLWAHSANAYAVGREKLKQLQSCLQVFFKLINGALII
jgi:hypothetical protein